MPKKCKDNELTLWTHSEEIVWYSVRDKLPDYVPNHRGPQVLIWPPHVSPGCADAYTAFFSDWITSNEPWFYLCGAPVAKVENWAYLPKGPAPLATSTKVEKTRKQPKRRRKK